MPRGGYRKPSNPAPVSNPGSGRRTDGGPTQAARYISGGQYGEGQQLMDMQRQAPMASSAPVRVPSPSMASAANALPITPITAPTQRPDEPLTTGMPFGAGGGPELLKLTPQTAKLSDTVSKLVSEDTTGEVAELYDYLISRGL